MILLRFAVSLLDLACAYGWMGRIGLTFSPFGPTWFANFDLSFLFSDGTKDFFPNRLFDLDKFDKLLKLLTLSA